MKNKILNFLFGKLYPAESRLTSNDEIGALVGLIVLLQDGLETLKNKFNNISKHICHMCKLPIIEGGRVQYMNKNFHNDTCFSEYLRIIEHPKMEYKSVNRRVVKYYEE